MDAIQWCRSYKFITDGTAEKVEQKARFLLTTLLAKKDDYQKEKFIKVFCEYLSYFEEVICYERGLHPNQIPYNGAAIAKDPDKHIQKVEEVKNRMESQIERLSEHLSIFMEWS